MRALVARLADPGRPLWGTLVLRVALAALFIPVGLGKFVNHDAYVERFERWGFGAAAGEVAILVGIVEVVCGLMLLLGVVPRLAALALAGNMVGALVTAGRIDGGQDIWLPLILIAALSVVVVWGAGRWALTPAFLRRGHAERTTLAGS
jgi:putative oxidoreductase